VRFLGRIVFLKCPPVYEVLVLDELEQSVPFCFSHLLHDDSRVSTPVSSLKCLVLDYVEGQVYVWTSIIQLGDCSRGLVISLGHQAHLLGTFIWVFRSIAASVAPVEPSEGLRLMAHGRARHQDHSQNCSPSDSSNRRGIFAHEIALLLLGLNHSRNPNFTQLTILVGSVTHFEVFPVIWIPSSLSPVNECHYTWWP